MSFSKSCIPPMLAAAMLLATANGHGYLTKPAVTFLSSSTDNTQFIATIESSASGFSGTFSGSPADNTAAFTTAFASSSYKSLKALINDKATVTVTDATLTCGSCDPSATAQSLPDTVEWSHSDSEGFTASHEGPCEVWCDDTRAFQDDDCAAHYTSAPAELPYDQSACQGASTLTFYWLALHSSTWQVYVNCASLSGSTSTSTSTSSNSTTSTTSTPSTTTAPTTASSTSSGTTSTSTSTTTTPTTTSSPSTGTTSTATTAPSTDSTSTSTTSTTTAPSTDSTSTTTTGSSGTTPNQGASTDSTTNGGWSTANSQNGTSGQQWSSTSNTGNSDVQTTTGTVSPNQGTSSGGWKNNGGWGNSFAFRH